MSDLFERVTGDQDFLKKLASHIPGFNGYVERQNRRAADKLLRETVALRFEEHVRRASNLQADLVSAGQIAFVDDVEKAVIQLRTFADKIRTASYGYSGFFDAVKINEEELAQMYAFDNAFFDIAAQIGSALDNLEASLTDAEALPAAIRNVVGLARQATEAFSRRNEVITGGQGG